MDSLNILNQWNQWLHSSMNSVEAFDPGYMIGCQCALHGMLVCAGEIDINEEISGQEVLAKAREYIKENMPNG